MLAILVCVGLGWMALNAAEALLPAAQTAGLEVYRTGLGLVAAFTLVVWPLVAMVVVSSFAKPLSAAVHPAVNHCVRSV